GSPAMANPCTSRKINKIKKESVKEITRKGRTDPINENLINTVLPFRSDKNPKITSPAIRPMIVSDMERLDIDTDTLNASTKTGDNGCTAYKPAKIKKDANARLQVIFQKDASLTV